MLGSMRVMQIPFTDVQASHAQLLLNTIEWHVLGDGPTADFQQMKA